MRLSTMAAFALSIILAGACAAQTTAPPDARQACRSSALSLCHHQAMSGDRAGVRACLIANFDKVTPDCQAAMKAAQAQMQSQAPVAKPDAPPPKP